MAQRAFQNERGITLIEVMISFVLIMITSLALMQSTMLAYSTNIRNETRDEAVKVAEQEMITIRNTPFDLLISDPTGTAFTRNIRQYQASFTARRIVNPINANNKEVDLSIAWEYRGKQFTHTVSTVVRK
jgi:type IV pilus assembly protein PilV